MPPSLHLPASKKCHEAVAPLFANDHADPLRKSTAVRRLPCFPVQIVRPTPYQFTPLPRCFRRRAIQAIVPAAIVQRT